VTYEKTPSCKNHIGNTHVFTMLGTCADANHSASSGCWDASGNFLSTKRALAWSTPTSSPGMHHTTMKNASEVMGVYPQKKTNMTMENQPVEDVSPMTNGDFPLPC